MPLRLMILPPLMHGAAQWAAFMLMAQGATLIFPDETRHVDPDDVWRMVEREKANSMTIVGDAVLRPLLVAARPEELRPLVVLRRRQRRGAAHPGRACHGAGAPAQRRHLRLGRLVRDRGADARRRRWTRWRSGSFLPGPGTVVVDEAMARVLEPGHEGNGWLAQTGSVPLGYLGDAAKTARTFPVIDGVRYSIPGDRARHRADGQIELLGRDSVTVNSGGEKIFVEEVERAIAGHPAVADVVVTGRPSERWGSEVVAVVQLAEGDAASADSASIVEHASAHIARYKLPKEVVFVERIQRSPSGKADYRWAAETAVKGAAGA